MTEPAAGLQDGPGPPIVLDTNCILAGFQFDNTKRYYTVPEAFEEIRRGNLKAALDGLMERGVLVVKAPSTEAVEAVCTAALGTGDWNRLSNADRALVALARELGGVLVTDDYSMQNVARVLGVLYRPFGKAPIRETLAWTYKCKGCARTFENKPKDCPVCGSEVVQKRKKMADRRG
jgi:UPF0271 protein